MEDFHPSRSLPPSAVREKFDALRAELADLAFALERRRQLDAADVAMLLHARVGEIRDELAPSENPADFPAEGVAAVETGNTAAASPA